MKLPLKNEKLLGGHAVALVGFDDEKKCLLLEIVGEKNGVIMDIFTCHIVFY